MTFELAMYRLQMFAGSLVNRQPRSFFDRLKMGAGGLMTQSIMGMCFVKVMKEGEQQWLKQKNAKFAIKK